MRRSGVSNAIAAGLLVAGILIGLVSFYVATTYQTKTVTQTETNTTSLTRTATQTLLLTTTQTTLATSTTVTSTTSTSTVSVYPLPDNVTLVFTNVDGYYTYDIVACSSSPTGTCSSLTSGTVTGPYTTQITGLFQGQTITITAATGNTLDGSNCRIGQHFSMQLFLNGNMVGQSSSSCTGSQAIIMYTV